jgi:hypothetical protein
MVEKKHGYGAEILIVIIAVAVVAGAYVGLMPGPPAVNVQIVPNGGVLQNITVSCYGCSSNGENVWQGTLSLEGMKTIDISGHTGASVGMTLEYGLGAPLSSLPDCTGLRTNSTCILTMTHDLPFDVGFHLWKAVAGNGNLKVIVYYSNGRGVEFNATSGDIIQIVHFQSV